MGAMMLENFLQISLLLLINVLSDDFLSNWSTFKNDDKLLYQKFLVSSLMSLMDYKYSFFVKYLKKDFERMNLIHSSSESST